MFPPHDRLIVWDRLAMQGRVVVWDRLAVWLCFHLKVVWPCGRVGSFGRVELCDYVSTSGSSGHVGTFGHAGPCGCVGSFGHVVVFPPQGRLAVWDQLVIWSSDWML